MGGTLGNIAKNTLDPFNLVHNGNSIADNIFEPWKSSSPSSNGTVTTTTNPTPVVPAPTLPVSPVDPTVVQTQLDYARTNMLKKSISQTIFAGDTGGAFAGMPTARRPGTGL